MILTAALVVITVVAMVVLRARTVATEKKANSRKPLSVNYHFSRVCNYSCKFCFHTSTNSYMASLEDAKKALKKLADAGMKKINFAGGEPFLQPVFLGHLVKYSKQELGLAVSIVSNGSKIRQSWFEKYAKFLDILAVSCDSFDESINREIGRYDKSTDHIKKMRQIAEWCTQFNVKFKINTVVCSLNFNENMVSKIEELNPFRWKCFQVLVLENENGKNGVHRDASKFIVTNKQFADFCKIHQHLKCFVPESNDAMQNSYLILDEKLRFLNCQNGSKDPSQSILDVDIPTALQQSGWDEEQFIKRGGVYEYTKTMPSTSTQVQCLSPELQW